MKQLRMDSGDDGSLEVRMFKEGKRYVVKDYLNGKVVTKRRFKKINLSTLN